MRLKALFILLILVAVRCAAATLNTVTMSVYSTTGRCYSIVLDDGMDLAIDNGSLSVTSRLKHVEFSIDDVSRITYNYTPMTTRLDALETSEPVITMTPDGLSIDLEGTHTLSVTDTAGRVLIKRPFNMSTTVSRSELPGSGVLVVAVDGKTAVKFVVR